MGGVANAWSDAPATCHRRLAAMVALPSEVHVPTPGGGRRHSEARPGSLSPFPAQLLKRLEFPVTGLVEASAAVRGSGRERPPRTGQGGGGDGEPRGGFAQSRV